VTTVEIIVPVAIHDRHGMYGLNVEVCRKIAERKLDWEYDAEAHDFVYPETINGERCLQRLLADDLPRNDPDLIAVLQSGIKCGAVVVKRVAVSIAIDDNDGWETICGAGAYVRR
jgi:hypothetical protein